MAFIELTAILVEDYDDAIDFFTEALGFELAEDSPARTNDGRAKRWVVVRPPGAETGILLARADGEHQVAASSASRTSTPATSACAPPASVRH
jgi:catechol 2,3-dioxygenase-like lactoylglutathione lyase family enzyme